MLRKLTFKMLYKRHPWRGFDFSELNEVYSSVLLRSIGVGMIGIFVPIYLYKLGYTIAEICLYNLIFFTIRPALCLLFAWYVARSGPKHAMLVSYILQIVGFLILLTMERLSWPLWVLSVFSSAALALYYIAFHVDLSKIKHKTHGGKEIGVTLLMERLGNIGGPLIGGVLASFVDPKLTIGLSLLILLFAAWPLFRTKEPVRSRQTLNYDAFPIKDLIPNSIAYTAYGMDNVGTRVIWPLFVGIFLVSSNAYAQVGAITALGAATAYITTRYLARLTDGKRIASTYRMAVLGNMLLYVGRVFVGGIGGAALVNVVNEPLTLGYQLPYLKALYDRVDELEGFRIITFTMFEIISNTLRAFLWLGLFLMTFWLQDKTVLSIGLILTGISSLGLFLEPSKLLKVKHT